MSRLDRLIARARQDDLSILEDPDVAKTNGEGTTALHCIALEGGQGIFKNGGLGVAAILRHPMVATIRDEDGQTPLHFLADNCAINGYSEDEDEKILKMIVAHPGVITPDNEGFTPLHRLAKWNTTAILEHPLAGRLVDDDGYTPLHVLANNDGLNVEVLNHPLVGTIKNNYGYTALHLFADRSTQIAGKGDRIILALAHPKIADARDSDFRTPLHLLAERGVVGVLNHPRVADPNAVDTKGNTPLHIIARRGVTATLEQPDVAKVKNYEGNAPLHLLAKTGCEAVLQHRDADTVKNIKGETPADIVRSFMKESENVKEGKTSSRKASKKKNGAEVER